MTWISINPKAVDAWISDWVYDVLDAADFGGGRLRMDEKDLANAYNRYGDPGLDFGVAKRRYQLPFTKTALLLFTRT